MKRRAFLGGLAAAAATGMASRPAAAGLLGGLLGRRIPLTREDHRVVVVGSGFGGGVSTLRLAEAGVPVTVLERGLWWPTGPNADTFPSVANVRVDQRALWYGTANPLGLYSDALTALSSLGLPSFPALYAGLLEVIPSVNMSVFCAAGVGGGSLVYQGMTLEPTEDVFHRVLPEELDYARMHEVFYPRVAEMLQVATAPDELIWTPNYLAARAFAEHAERAGYSVEKIPMPIDWTFALRELAGEMKPSYTNGDCFLGVNNGGKHSVDVTYIDRAMATGIVDVRALHNVTHVGQAADGRWQVFVDRTDESGRVLEKKILTTRALILAAGSVGTTRLLQRAQHRGLMRNLPDGIGEDWGTNGDRIVTWTSLTDEFGPVQGGPVIYGSKEWENPDLANTVIQASIPPLGIDARTTVTVGFGVSDARGKWVYDPLTDDSHLIWKREADAVLHKHILKRMRNIVGPASVLGDTHLAAPMTWHPLGGANMGTVCDLEGRVRENPGLYVLDGALIPGSTAACNPSMTIAAIAERAMEKIVATDVGTVF